MNRYYEKKLPADYREALVIDTGKGRLGSGLAAAMVLTDVVLFGLIHFLYTRERMNEIASGFRIVGCIGFIVAYFLYVVLHELTHGIVYKLLTGQKLTFGFKPPTAYCGVPDIYTYRITSLLSLFAPLTVYSVLFLVLFFVVNDPFVRLLILSLFALHLAGCVGDLYNIGLFLFRFRDPATLRKDNGPAMIYYTKE